MSDEGGSRSLYLKGWEKHYLKVSKRRIRLTVSLSTEKREG
jgi:hypothetical protein